MKTSTVCLIVLLSAHGTTAGAVASKAMRGAGMPVTRENNPARKHDSMNFPDLVKLLGQHDDVHRKFKTSNDDTSLIDHGALSLKGGDNLADDTMRTMQMVISHSLTDDHEGTAPLGGYLSNITAILDRMDKATQTAHNATQTYVDGLSSAFHDCDPTKNGTLSDFINQYNDGLDPHKTCRQNEKQFKTDYDSCVNAKAAFDAVNGAPNPTAACAVDPVNNENKENWLDRMARQFDTANATWHQKKKAYDDAAAIYSTNGCVSTVYDNQKKACDDKLKVIEQSACSWAQGVKHACNENDDCYSGKVTAFEAAKATAETEEHAHKTTWRGVQRMRCILGAIDNASVTTLQACLTSAASDTSHLNVNYPPTPAKVICQAPTVYPCTTTYNTAVYSPLPAGLVVPTCNPCQLPVAATTTTTTTPAQGGVSGVIQAVKDNTQATPTTPWTVEHRPPEYHGGYKLEKAQTVGTRGLGPAWQPAEYIGPDRQNSQYAWEGDPSFYMVLKLNAPCTIQKLQVVPSATRQGFKTYYCTREAKIGVSSSATSFDNLVDVSFPCDVDKDHPTGSDCHNLADGFYDIPLNAPGQYIKIEMTKYGSYSTGFQYIGVICN